MKKITVPCPECKNILARSIDFKGEGSLETLCPHCKEIMEIGVIQVPKVTVSKCKKKS